MEPFVPPEELAFDEVTVRCWRPGDGAALARAVRAEHAHLAPWMPWATPDYADAEGERHARHARGRWLLGEDFGLALLVGGEVVGGSGFHPRRAPLADGVAEVGLWCASSRAGTRLGTRTLRALLRWGLTAWPWERLEWRCDDRNVASWTVAERAGMRLEGTLRADGVRADGSRRDARVYAALRSERAARER